MPPNPFYPPIDESSRRIYANVDGLRNVIRILGRSNEQIRRLKVEDIIDERIAKKLEKEGLF